MSRQRWVMLALLSLDICVSYLPYYAFVPIQRQSMMVYSVDEESLNMLCIVYAFVYVPGAFLTGPVVGWIGCRWTFILAMSLNFAGCVVKFGPEGLGMVVPSELRSHGLNELHNVTMVETAPIAMSFSWLLLGQTFCAMGQPFLVNCTSEMGAEWFPSSERPAAAMISNLMNFVGSSLSFLLPSLCMDDHPESLEVAQLQMRSLLQVQTVIAAVALVLTWALYQANPSARVLGVPRSPVSFRSEVARVFQQRDFWLINWQFAMYVAVGHAFDAVEGSLLEHYGYSAGLTSWTGVSCGVTSIFATLLESKYISSASSYRPALVIANIFIVASQLIGFVALHWHMHESVFVFAIGVMGLATPGWGCSCELASEVSFPAREATVSSILEVFSNLTGVVAIVVTQRLIDAGFGAHVLLLTAVASLFGGSSLYCLSGRLPRSEAEASLENGWENGWAEGTEDESKSTRLTCNWGRASARLNFLRCARMAKAKTAWASLLGVGLLMTTVGSVGPFDLFKWMRSHADGHFKIHQSFNASMQGLVNHSMSITPQKQALLSNGLAEPINVVITCRNSPQQLKRFRKFMEKANMTFQVVHCVNVTPKTVAAAVHDGLLPYTAKMAFHGLTTLGIKRSMLIGTAISHLRVLRSISVGSVPIVNVFDDSEIVLPNFEARRNKLLSVLPKDLEYVNLNALHPAGDRVLFSDRSLRGKAYRMKTGLSPLTNGWMSNYIVSKRGARRLLQACRSYDTFGRWELFDEHILSTLYSSPLHSFHGFSVKTNFLSIHCPRKEDPLRRVQPLNKKSQKMCSEA